MEEIPQSEAPPPYEPMEDFTPDWTRNLRQQNEIRRLDQSNSNSDETLLANLRADDAREGARPTEQRGHLANEESRQETLIGNPRGAATANRRTRVKRQGTSEDSGFIDFQGNLQGQNGNINDLSICPRNSTI